ncbi:MAG TPA: HAMP domain-containing sensor histidine kinase [Abditibacteriaceae bacterium]|jgi:signal transduction histidine kinase
MKTFFRAPSMRARLTIAFTLFLLTAMLALATLLAWRARWEAERLVRAELAAMMAQARAQTTVAGLGQIFQAQREDGGEIELWLFKSVEPELMNEGATRDIVWRSGPRRFRSRDGRPPRDGRDDPRRDGRRNGGRRPDGDRPHRPRGLEAWFSPPRPPRENFGPSFVPPLDDPPGWRARTLRWNGNTLVVGAPWFRTERALREQLFSLLLLGLSVCVVTAAGAWVLVGRTLAPIGDLARQAAVLGRANPAFIEAAPQLRPPSPDREVQELVETLNTLLLDVNGAAQARARFHSAASHELRTPLQALSGHLQLALSRPREREELLEALREAETHSGRLESLVRDLLALDQLHQRRELPAASGELVDVTSAVEAALRQTAKLRESRALETHLALEECSVAALPTHCEMLARNLIENAAKYARSRMSVVLTSSRLEVSNDSDAVPDAAEAARWFEPFHRPDAARHSSTGGNGLGLAICAAICESNGWSFRLDTGTSAIRLSVDFAQSTVDS